MAHLFSYAESRPDNLIIIRDVWKTDLFLVHKLNPLTSNKDQPFFAIMLVKTLAGKRINNIAAVK